MPVALRWCTCGCHASCTLSLSQRSRPTPWCCPPLSPPRSNLASDDGLQQLQFILNGMFGRACKNLGNPEATAMLVQEVGDVRDTLISKLAGEPELQTAVQVSDCWLAGSRIVAQGAKLLPHCTTLALQLLHHMQACTAQWRAASRR